MRTSSRKQHYWPLAKLGHDGGSRPTGLLVTRTSIWFILGYPRSSFVHLSGWRQAGELGVALLLSGSIGVKREIRQKNAQIVSGVGLLGATLTFVRRDVVRGLTTAAAIWITAAIGAAAGAGLGILAAEATVAYLVIALAFPCGSQPSSERRQGRPPDL